jgi:membrane-bound lytic murein transglycosylase B
MGVVAALIGGLSIAALQRTAASATAPLPVAMPAVEDEPSPTDATTPNSLPSSVVVLPIQRIDPTWAQRVATQTGIPPRALLAYASASVLVGAEESSCGLSWNTLAGIGLVESGHASHGGAHLLESGQTDRPIRGPALNGHGLAAIPDSDDGVWDGDSRWDRAVGPMQFIPGTWRKWGADGNSDGKADPNQIDDAALAAARYLCASGSMRTGSGWRAAVYSYNHSDAYVDKIAAVANQYAAEAG